MNVQCHSCIGGTNLGEDIRKLDYGQHVVSGKKICLLWTAYMLGGMIYMITNIPFPQPLSGDACLIHTYLFLRLGTPGRVFDMIRRRTLRTRGIKMLVRMKYLKFQSNYDIMILLLSANSFTSGDWNN